MKAGQHPKWKDKCWGHCGIVVPFAKAVIDVIGRPPQRGGNGKWQHTCRLLSTSSLEEEAMSHDARSQKLGFREMLEGYPLLGNVKHQL
jgi:hypothetical protein